MRAGKVLAAVLAATLVAGACAGGGDSDSAAERPRTAPESSEPPASATAPADPSAAEAEIRVAFEKYFDSNTPEGEATALAEDVEEILPTLQQAATRSPGGHRTVAVTSVVFTSDTTAAVAFDILYDGNPLLFGFGGGAVEERGIWKISRKTNCDLTALAGFSCPDQSNAPSA